MEFAPGVFAAETKGQMQIFLGFITSFQEKWQQKVQQGEVEDAEDSELDEFVE